MTPKPLRQTLMLKSMLAVVLPFAAVVVFAFAWFTPQIRSSAELRHLQLARAVGMQVESHLETAGAIVRAAAAMPKGKGDAGTVYQKQLDALKGSADAINSLYRVDPDGKVSYVAIGKDEQSHRDDMLSLSLSGNPLFRAVTKDRKPLWSEAFLSVINGGLAVAYAVPSGGAMVIGEVDLTLLTKFLKQISGERDVLILIVDHNGQVVADNNGQYTAQQLNIGNIPLIKTGLTTDVGTTGRFDFAGQSMTGSIIQVPTMDWHVMVARTNASLYSTPRNIALTMAAGILLALLCSMTTTIYQTRKLAAQFDELNQHARNIAEGEKSREWPNSTIEEFNQLSANLQLMSSRLQESEMLYRELFEHTPDGIVLWSIPDLRPLQFNPAAHNMLGYSSEEFSSLSVTDLEYLQNAEQRAEILAVLQRDGTASFESTYRKKSNDHCHVLVSLKMIKLAGQQVILSIRRDLAKVKQAEAERSKLEQQLLQSLGVLAGGIAHDFNNILMTIIGNADLALMRINKESPAIENLNQIEQAAARAADLAKQMLAYSGKGRFVVEALDLNVLLEEMLHMLQVSISKKAVLRFNLHQPLPLIEADATQMRQIVMNLVINASEAIGDRSGTIAISSGCMDCDHNYLKNVWLDENLSDGLYVYLEVSDTGCGMDKETLSRIFDPFFTTKFTGRGLGMAAVLGIVRGHKGAIKVYSEPGKGTTFKVLLPASGLPAEQISQETPGDSWQGSGKVLLVDDEETVRGIGSAMLKALGFTAITACDGREALEVFRSNPDIGFVILDLTMPRMDGEQCFRELRQLNPDVKVIISSGYNEQEVTRKFVGKGLAGFVQKPYRLSVLKEAIRSVLE
jgi:PAS domain S-box-containing protein